MSIINSNLAKRILTSIVIIPPVIGLIYLGGYFVVALSLLIFILANYEYFTFALRRSPIVVVIAVACNLVIPISFLIWGNEAFIRGVLISSVLLLALCVFLIEFDKHVTSSFESVNTFALGIAYPGVIGSALVALTISAPSSWLFWLLLVVIFTDTFAYFGGSLIGGAKLAPRISPKKTVSGVIVGVIGGVSASILANYLFSLNISIFLVGLLGLFMSLLAVIGDLVESMVKRAYGIKDSGNLLPGHGGILDRVDGLIFAAIVLLFIS